MDKTASGRGDPFDSRVEVDWQAVRRRFDDAGYTLDALSNFAGVSRPQSDWDMKVAIRRTAGRQGLNVLMRLFLFGSPVPAADVEGLIGKGQAESLIKAGFMHHCGEGAIRAECTLLPYGEFLVIHDFGEIYTGKVPAEDHVIAIGDSTMLLAYMTPRFKASSALDLGAGSGFQAMLASKHCSRVVATDVSDRALAFARASMRMNGISSVDVRKGSFFEPVEGEKFDLIASNPPFVISPGIDYTYRDCGIKGDSLCEMLLRNGPRFLAEGGYYVVLFNWTHGRDEDWRVPLARWCSGNGCDVMAFRFVTQDPLEYSAGWLSALHRCDPALAERELDAWVRNFGEKGIERITWGGAVMRRRTAQGNWFRGHDAQKDWTSGQRGEQIKRMFANTDAVESAAAGRSDLLDLPLVLSPEHVFVCSFEAGDREDGGRGWKPIGSRFHLSSGFSFRAATDHKTGDLLSRLDGRKTLRQAAAEFAQRIGVAPETITSACREAVVPLLEGGFLTIGTE